LTPLCRRANDRRHGRSWTPLLVELIRFILAASGPLGHRLILAMVATSLSMGALMVVINLATSADQSNPGI